MDSAELEYLLPPDRIAQSPVSPRDAARLLVLDRAGGALADHRFAELPALLGPHDLLVVNDTRVRPARVTGRRPTGGRAELLLLEPRGADRWTALVRTGARLRRGLTIQLDGPGAWDAEVLDVGPDGAVELQVTSREGACADARALPEAIGRIPLPRYIHAGCARPSDAVDYQTIFASPTGSVAAPTASLHFTEALAARLPIARITLHVGPGTFRPIRAERVEDHRIDAEVFTVPETTARAIAATRAAGGRVTAVGTTVARALETTGGRAGEGRTELLIAPGHRFVAIDALITNFHLPRSSLLALVMALGGVAHVRAAYAHAIAAGYRFYSYGDAMWVR
jgi:S-adenosylmethionine:tRNA ribosyltransferase-isomerase